MLHSVATVANRSEVGTRYHLSHLGLAPGDRDSILLNPTNNQDRGQACISALPPTGDPDTLFVFMARKPRIEITGGLYHLITRGNNRQTIFNSHDDYLKMLSLIRTQKSKLPFYLYAYCLMPNHLHLLVERRGDPLSRVMHRVLTGYSQYYNRRYQKSGHLLQGRYKAILCQSDQYLGELVRYIHLNPVRAGLVRRPEQYQYSSHRTYLGVDEEQLADAEAVLRYFGARKTRAIERYKEFVKAGMSGGHREEFYKAEEGRVLGSEEFVAATKRRIGDVPRGARPQMWKRMEAGQGLAVSKKIEVLFKAIQAETSLERREICSGDRRLRVIAAKEAMALIGVEKGVTQAVLAEVLGLDSSVISRRVQAAKAKMAASNEFRRLIKRIRHQLDHRL